MEKKRLQFDFTQDALEELDQLQKATGLPSRAELIRHSLRLLQWVVDQTQNKKATLLIEKDGRIRELLLLPSMGSGSVGSGSEAPDRATRRAEELVSLE
jgi:hypothetical protein